MKKPIQIGITGGIGSGKSLVCKIYNSLGVPVYDADSHAKELMTTDGILVSAIKKEFGDLSYHDDGTLNRQRLASTVFHDEARLKRLNELVHPRVAEDYKRWVDKQTTPYTLKEAALMFESGSHVGLDRIILVHAPEALRIQRVLIRDPQRTAEQIKAIVGKQMPEDEKMKRAHHIIVNDETQLIIPQVLKLHQEFTKLAAA